MAKQAKELLLLIATISFFHQLHSLTVCGYHGSISEEFEQEFDRCYSQNVQGSRVRMAVEFEKCFGFEYETLNNTVSGPYRKKEKDTVDLLRHFSDSICSDNEDALNEFILRNSTYEDINEDKQSESEITPNTASITKCQAFLGEIEGFITQQNFDISKLMNEKDESLALLFPNQETRKKIAQVVINMVRPLANCHQPMQELQIKLIRKYLKRFLMDQITVGIPSFSYKTLPIIKHPELFVLHSEALGENSKLSPIDWERKPYRSLFIPPRKEVRIRNPNTLKPSEKEMNEIVKLQIQNEGVSADQKRVKLQSLIENGKISKTDIASMSPKQQLEAGIIDENEYKKKVFRDERLGPGSPKFQVENIWDDHLRLKKNDFRDSDFDRYNIKGFDSDKKIQELFNDK